MPTKSWLPQGHRNYFIDGYISEETLINRCLACLAGKTLIEQLKLRKIKVIRYFVGDRCGAYGWMIPVDDGFEMYVNCSNTLAECVETVAHELGHTFVSYYLDSDNIALTKPVVIHLPRKKAEEFCENFMKRWLEQGANQPELESLLGTFFKGESDEIVIF